jgi:hypothetical protein
MKVQCPSCWSFDVECGEFVDVGPGEVQATGHSCNNCGASQNSDGTWDSDLDIADYQLVGRVLASMRTALADTQRKRRALEGRIQALLRENHELHAAKRRLEELEERLRYSVQDSEDGTSRRFSLLEIEDE